VPGGQLNPTGGTSFAPGIHYATQAQREATPVSLDELRKSKLDVSKMTATPTGFVTVGKKIPIAIVRWSQSLTLTC
jgi:hypothetical protein